VAVWLPCARLGRTGGFAAGCTVGFAAGLTKCIEWLVVPSRGPQVYEGQDALDCEVLPWRVPYIIKLRLAAEDAGAIMLTHVCPSSFFRRGATWMSRSHSAG